jgi:hypothetical protein
VHERKEDPAIETFWVEAVQETAPPSPFAPEQDRATGFGHIASFLICNSLRIGACRENCRAQDEQGELLHQKEMLEPSAHKNETHSDVSTSR